MEDETVTQSTKGHLQKALIQLDDPTDDFNPASIRLLQFVQSKDMYDPNYDRPTISFSAAQLPSAINKPYCQPESSSACNATGFYNGANIFCAPTPAQQNTTEEICVQLNTNSADNFGCPIRQPDIFSAYDEHGANVNFSVLQSLLQSVPQGLSYIIVNTNQSPQLGDEYFNVPIYSFDNQAFTVQDPVATEDASARQESEDHEKAVPLIDESEVLHATQNCSRNNSNVQIIHSQNNTSRNPEQHERTTFVTQDGYSPQERSLGSKMQNYEQAVFDNTYCVETERQHPEKDQRHKRMYKCEFPACAKVYTNVSNLRRHLTKHTEERPSVCKLTKRKLEYSGAYKCHIFNNPGEKLNVCDICSKQFSRYYNFLRHMKNIHGIINDKKDRSCSVIKKSQTHKIHSCHIPGCNEVFTIAWSLKRHLLCHTNVRPFLCSWKDCGKNFKRRAHLTRHLLVHTVEKPFECKVCNERFSYSKRLSEHVKIHSTSYSKENIPDAKKSQSVSTSGLEATIGVTPTPGQSQSKDDNSDFLWSLLGLLGDD